uniref:ATP synthase F0 subunit 6 n=1 Tax=Capillaria sp. cat-2018 TaxID=2488633 RepID=A0A6M2UJR3_9BILA|nr:ATP synthase F0 subunit 6 [Capillaria sp. cat-2018]
MMKLKNLRTMMFYLVLLLLSWFLLNKFMTHSNFDDMMYPHMELSPMMWNSNNLLNMVMSLLIYIILIMMIPKFNYFDSRWDSMLKKIVSFNFNNLYKEYAIVSSLCLIIFLLNFYSLFSFNWVPNTQNWFILIITTMFLFSIWLKMMFSGGMKIFGEKIPISWYLLNFMLWFFHNLSFFIRFISLPFRMMMNLIVGMFLVDFAKSFLSLTSFVSIYEVFVMLVQTMVFIILANMYYSEMVMLPEWKTHKSTYNLNLNIKLSPWLSLLKLYIINLFSKLS